jgi:hypothetical protein
VADDTTATRSAGVFGAASASDAEALAGLPDGAWAAGFAGNVWVSGNMVGATPALLVENGDDEALLQGDVVAWAGAGLVRRADAATSWTGPVAGIALAAAAPGASLAIATGGLVPVRTQGGFDAGEALGWDGAKATASASGDRGIVGVAVAAESPGPTRLVTIQLRPGFSP